MRSRNDAKLALRLAALVAVSLLMPAGLGITEAVQVTSGSTSPGEGESTAAKGSVGSESQIVVYYFHGERRCNTCGPKVKILRPCSRSPSSSSGWR